jgi:hypothetical protein
VGVLAVFEGRAGELQVGESDAAGCRVATAGVGEALAGELHDEGMATACCSAEQQANGAAEEEAAQTWLGESQTEGSQAWVSFSLDSSSSSSLAG